MHLLSLARSLAITAVVTAALAAQDCSSLTITGSGAPNTTLVFALRGDPSAPSAVAISDTLGTSSTQFGPFGTLVLGIMPPYVIANLGLTTEQGLSVLSIPIPPALLSLDLLAQGVTTTLSIGPSGLQLTFCTSNVEGFHVGM